MTDVLERSSAVRTAPRGNAPDDPMSAPLLETMAVLLKHIRIMVIVPLVIFSLAVLNARSRREYMAQSRFSPAAQSTENGGLLGMAAQLGVGMQAGRQNESVDFYADLLRSREVLDSLAATSFRFTAEPDDRDTLSGTYIQLYQFKGRNDFDRTYRARRKLEATVSVTLKRQSGLVTVQVRAKWGRLAEQMNRRLLDIINEFNLQRRRTTAGSERAFLESRLQAVGAELADDQATLRLFLERNRAYQDDPRLSLEMQNRSRKVDQTQQIYQGLLTQFERARADEVRDTPLITIVEAPEGSRKRSSGVLMAGLLGMVSGVLLACGLALTLEYLNGERSRNPEAYASFRKLWAGMPRRFLGLPR